MHPFEFTGSKIIGKPTNMSDDECSGIFATTGVDQHGFHYFLTAWMVSPEDLENMKAGHPMFVKTVGNGLPPMNLFTAGDAANLTIPIGELAIAIGHFVANGFSVGFKPVEGGIEVVMGRNEESSVSAEIPLPHFYQEAVVSALISLENAL